MVLRVLFEQERPAEPFALAEAWLDARVAAAAITRDDIGPGAGLAVLAEASASLPADAPHDLARAALLSAVRRAGIDTRTAWIADRTADDVAATVVSAAAAAPASFAADLAEPLFVGNAGLVLIAPFILALFDRLGLTGAAGFVDDAAARRAVHVLQLAVDGGAVALEPQLLLNKLLCGLDLAIPVEREFVATAEERATIDELLAAVIAHWGKLGSTTIDGLRAAFLQRPGLLVAEPQAWRLTPEPRGYDVLIDQIPWGFRTIKQPWMPKVMHVDWH